MQTSLEHSRRYAAQALGRMLKSSVAPIPENYTLWYTAASGQVPDLARLVEELERNPAMLTPDALRDAYRRFFTAERESALVQDAFHTLDRTLAQTVKTITRGGSEVRTFTQTLATGATNLASAGDDMVRARHVVDGLLTQMQDLLVRQQALEHALGTAAENLGEMRGQLDAMRKEVATDSLTGLTNRKYFEVELTAAVRDAHKHNLPLCLAMVDIDHFKRINDNFGHPVGDQVLRVVASILARVVPRQAVAARYGGEEFALVLPGLTLQQAVDLCETLRLDVASKSLRNKSSGQSLGTITVSAGVAQLRAGEAMTVLVDHADRALYTAKHEGRNRVCSHSTGVVAV
jgi:diguanylate cyclase